MSPLGNPAMKMPMMGGHMGMPNLMSMIPGVDAGAHLMMKDMMKKKGVASFEELRSLATRVRRAHDRLPDDHGPVRVHAWTT